MDQQLSPQRSMFARLWAGFAVLMVAALLLSGTALGRENPRTREAADAGTPVAALAPEPDPIDGDPRDATSDGDEPLDGDPLDGDPSRRDVEESVEPPADGDLEIVRSGRPETAPRSVVAYDDDVETVWTLDSDADESWLWLDLGEEARVREVYWQAAGAGTIAVSVSDDRERWTEIDELEVERSWQRVELREDARYVRLDLLPDDDGALPELAEVAVYGRDGKGDVSAEQDAKRDRKGKRHRRGKREERSRQKADKDDGGKKNRDTGKRKDNDKGKRRRGNRDRSGTRSSGNTGVSAQQGETSCRGDGERCRAREGKVRMDEECGDDGSCTIDVNVDGGSALCDATGGAGNKAGDGEGRRAGEGGECEAVADGGAVSIGDINP